MKDNSPTLTPKQIRLQTEVPKSEWNNFLGHKLTEQHYDELIDYDCDVFTPEGDVLLHFRRNAIPVDHAARAFAVLRKINQKSMNRGMATTKGAQVNPIRKSGYRSNTNEVSADQAVNSSIIGFYDRYVRTPYCRQTAFNAKQAADFKECLPYFQSIARLYQEINPLRFAAHWAVVDRTNRDWIIPGTPFTTVTVNKNWQTAVHTDKGDLKTGLSTITVLRAGEFIGAHLVFPHYRVAVKIDTCDLLLFNSHHMHGNTPLIGKINQFERVSCVCYYREKMHECGTAAEELERAKKRKRGDPLYDSKHYID